ncbi:vWA domain-containing protein [Vibrio aestuarianus]|uniref:BatA (Bacteroides aerotolerance operon) n=1 Tax=Vibrio aestuarianus TaxID=28171 RepID=A0ABN8TLY0_9VIBR|nr:VWA domain-containing protein [Vibrio aestuarianus]MDE1214594.1 VWA domain-containing protein [Vibrio aestuarianus]MDE1218771.1 VWA domain-containing protein [Vibrio aestuarianus]MDE1229018.1 VWA domain-containing protein [Vibrio aestuarianus]MDE1258194.1 VWA domain-containing protein [Vibrio aestuarianus]MDE1261649.1 VWA domain-containing protein [Vibrio aestuarianus]
MANIELLWWWALLLLPLPLVIYRFLPPVKERAAIHLPYLPKQDQISSPRNIAIKAIATAIWCLLILAVARPVWYDDPVTTQPKHRDLMLVVDLSYSMSQEDMQQGGQYIDRLTAVKNVLSDFIQKREGDRLGLVLFADHAYLQTPLTLDKNTISEQLNQAVLKLIGTQTAIGEGIGLATKTFIDSDALQRVMILLSDGSNTSGVLDPLEAAKIAKKYDATIYTIGVGAGEMMVKEFFMTRKVNTAQDLDEKTLTEIANITGGKYFRARNSQDLANIYDTINQLEPISQATQTWRPQTEWFGYPLLAALMLSVILIVLRRNHV